MPVQITLKDENHTVDKLARYMSDRNVTKANVRAINTAIKKSKTQYRREIVKQFNLKYGETKPMVKPNNATYTNQKGTIKGAINPISLSRFNPTFISGGKVFSIKSIKNKDTGKRGLQQKSKKAAKKDKSGGVTIEVHKGEKKTLPFAFLVNSEKKGISKQIWARGKYVGNKFQPGKNRKPITALKTVSPFGMMTKPETNKSIQTTASDSLKKEFERQINLLLRQAGATN